MRTDNPSLRGTPQSAKFLKFLICTLLIYMAFLSPKKSTDHKSGKSVPTGETFSKSFTETVIVTWRKAANVPVDLFLLDQALPLAGLTAPKFGPAFP